MTDYEQYMDQWEAESLSKGQHPDAYFLEYACELLDAIQGYDLSSYSYATYNKPNIGGGSVHVLDGYCFDEANRNNITLLHCDFSYERELQTLNNASVKALFQRVEKFFFEAYRGKLNQIAPGRPIYELIEIISKGNVRGYSGFDSTCGTLNIHIITNKRALRDYEPTKTIELENGCELTINYRLSDFNDIKDAKPQPLIVDFSSLKRASLPSDGVPYLKVPKANGVDFYESYLFVMPADALAEFYDQYGSRLLEQNVRVYLQKKGKINKGMHKTIENEPYVFFVYNNGLAITAEGIEFSEDRSKIVRIHGMQVVNGGQTMACLHQAWRERKDISGISVQVKLTMVTRNISDVIVPYISKFSNSQNAVKETDMHSNDFVQRCIEQHSRKIKTPGIPTSWYYERLRGQYDNARLHLQGREKVDFERANPKKQKFTPLEFSQAIMMFELVPYLLTRGAQKTYNGTGNIQGFCDIVSTVWNVNPGVFSSTEWYKRSIGKLIFFRRAKKELRDYLKSTGNQLSAFGAAVVIYTASVLIYILRKQGYSINDLEIWEKQDIDSGMIEVLKHFCDFITNILGKRADVSEWVKKNTTWEYVLESAESAFNSGQLRLNIRATTLFKAGKVAMLTEMAQAKEKASNYSDIQNKVLRIYPEAYWQSLYDWLRSHDFASTSYEIFDKRLRQQKLPNKQCEILLNTVQIALKNGWEPPYNPEEDFDFSIARDRIRTATGNPLNAFFNQGTYDVLVLDRTCDYKSGSSYLDSLFEEHLYIKEAEKMESVEAPEIGNIRAFRINDRQMIVFAYTRQTEESVQFAPIIEVALQKVAAEFHDKRILIPYMNCSGDLIRLASAKAKFTEIVKKILYAENVVIMGEV